MSELATSNTTVSQEEVLDPEKKKASLAPSPVYSSKSASSSFPSPNTEVGQALDSGRLLSTGTKGFQGLLANVPSGNRLQWSELTLEGVIGSRGFSNSLHFIPTQIPIKMLCSNKKKSLLNFNLFLFP